MPNADNFELMLVFVKPSQGPSRPCLYTTSLGSQYLIVFDTTRSPFSSWQSFPSGNHQHFGSHILTLATNNLLATIFIPWQPSPLATTNLPWHLSPSHGNDLPPLATISLLASIPLPWQPFPSLRQRNTNSSNNQRNLKTRL